MKIYTGQTSGETLNKLVELGLGIMISSGATTTPQTDFKKTFCALDNGAFTCYRRGFPFMESVFIKTLEESYKKGINLDFIVTPDIVAGGRDSLNLSLEWAYGKLRTAPKLALVVQDGMGRKDIGSLSRFTHIFVGGSKEWKWKTAKQWVDYAHDNGKLVHIGQCGRFEYLMAAHEMGADSVDSTSFTVNQSWHIVEQYYDEIGYKPERNQLNLFSNVV